MIIKIFAGPGEGKSTVASKIAAVLKEYGIQVDNQDPDQLQNYEQNLASMDQLKVEIKTIPYRRETLPEYALKWKQGQS